MPDSDFDRALADGARRSAEAARRAPALPEGWGEGRHRAALRTWGAAKLPTVWERHKRKIIWIALFLLFDFVVMVAVATMGTHF